MLLRALLPPCTAATCHGTASSMMLAKSCPDHHDPAVVEAMLRWHTGVLPPALEHTVSEAEAGERLTRIAGQRFAQLGTKSQAENAVKRGALLVNNEEVEKARKVKLGDTLTFQPPTAAVPDSKRLESRARFVEHLRLQGLRAVYEDDHLAVVFKPPGIHTKAGTNVKFAALEDALAAELTPPPVAASDALPLPLVMHRLDVPVAGVCLAAKTRSAAVSLSRQFATREVQKTYHALLVGCPPQRRMEISTPIDGLPASTSLEVLATTPHPQWGHLSMVRLMPHTGRTHQLRVHVAGLGCPIVGDDFYWEAAADARARHADPAQRAMPPIRKTGGLFLQSCGVRFTHPASTQLGLGSTVDVMVARAPKFAALFERARKASAYGASPL
jgi:23S rRNA pseudouridine1911/1915/1917 synthase